MSPRPLPELVVLDLGHRRAEALVQLGLRGLDVLPFPLERAVLGEVQLDREDAYVSAGHSRIKAGIGAFAGAADLKLRQQWP